MDEVCPFDTCGTEKQHLTLQPPVVVDGEKVYKCVFRFETSGSQAWSCHTLIWLQWQALPRIVRQPGNLEQYVQHQHGFGINLRCTIEQ